MNKTLARLMAVRPSRAFVGAVVLALAALSFAAPPVFADFSFASGPGGPFTPVKIGGASQIGGSPVVMITAGQCAHACEIQDITAGGFWYDAAGGTPVVGTSEFIPAGGVWFSTVGLTTAVTIIPFRTGIITGSVQ